MSLNYAASLSPYANKGKCGLPEKFDSIEVLNEKCEILAKYINESKMTVAITGAGISTSCGIPDFRGPNGVWTLEKKGKLPDQNISFDKAIPSYTHYALVELTRLNKLNFLISQNIDGLHMRSGFPLNRLAELHGNMFLEKCHSCLAKHIKFKCVETIGLKPTGRKCLKEKPKGNCRGELHDTILDWEDSLPTEDMEKSELNCKKAELCLCLGSTLQILPVGNYPLLTKKNGGKIVIINLQETKNDKHADLIINSKLDLVFEILLEKYLNLKLNYDKLSPKIEIKLKLDQDIDQKLLLDVKNVVIDPILLKAEPKIELENKWDYESKNNQPNIVLLFSGKRKSGKDFTCLKLVDHLKSHLNLFNITLITLSAPIKEEFSLINNLNYEKLLDSSEYKEKFRYDMIKWSESIRDKDPSFFCRKAIDKSLKDNQISIDEKQLNLWIVTDMRRKTDLNYFRSIYFDLIRTVRVLANDEVRKNRNWKFQEGIDNAASECDLDSIKDWDFLIKNNNQTEFDQSFNHLIHFLENFVKIKNSLS